MAFKLIESAVARSRAVNGPHLVDPRSRRLTRKSRDSRSIGAGTAPR